MWAFFMSLDYKPDILTIVGTVFVYFVIARVSHQIELNDQQ